MAEKFWDQRGVDLLRFIGMVVREDDGYLLQNNLYKIQDVYSENLKKAIKTVQDNNLDIIISNPKFREWFPDDCPIGQYDHKNRTKLINFNSVHNRFQFDIESPIGNNCSSPFTTARIDYDGNVYLCHNQLIGNLKTESFDDIWGSNKAISLREDLVKTQSLCGTCDYFKLCINTSCLDTKSPENYFSNDFKQRFPDKFQEIINNKAE